MEVGGQHFAGPFSGLLGLGVGALSLIPFAHPSHPSAPFPLRVLEPRFAVRTPSCLQERAKLTSARLNSGLSTCKTEYYAMGVCFQTRYTICKHLYSGLAAAMQSDEILCCESAGQTLQTGRGPEYCWAGAYLSGRNSLPRFLN